MLDDNLDNVFSEFFDRRTSNLYQRFPGWYRAVVEDTNDPLIARRVRVRIPELHDDDVPVQDLPWAVPASGFGGQNAGFWSNCSKDDEVFVCFEKNHPYAPVYTAAANPTRRRMYSLWSIYGQTPLAVDPDGKPAEKPQDFERDYLPKDGRPMSMGFNDRYGHFLLLNSVGFHPSTHQIKPAAVGTDAVGKTSYNLASASPVENDPDGKLVAMGTKYGHTMVMGDQGYQWTKDFKGDFQKDQEYEIARYKYFLKSFCEQQAKDRDQRRMEWRTRAGHLVEMRDVGWNQTRPGEYLDARQTIADSQGRDERWIKIRTKGGHLFQAYDRGFDQVADNFYKRLNKSEFGSSIDQEEEFGDDARFMRMITRHGNQFWLDDRGSSATAGEEETPHGNGFMIRTRKGFQAQAVDKPELDHFMVASPKDQVLELNDRFQYVLLSTSQAGPVHTTLTKSEVRGRPKFISKTGQANDPAGTTQHLILDRLNDMVRLKTATPGAESGLEVRGPKASCGRWVECHDFEGRSLWMSTTDNHLMLRDKSGGKFILLDDNDEVVLIRNENGRIQIRANGNIEIKSDGKICLDADEIGLKATKQIAVNAGGNLSVFNANGFSTMRDLGARKVKATVDKPAPDGAKPCDVIDKEVGRRKPDNFDNERGCDNHKPQKGPVPEGIINSSPGGGTGGGAPPAVAPGDPLASPPASSPLAPVQPGAIVQPPPAPVPDPIDQFSGTGVLWYGLSSKFSTEVDELGLGVGSLANHLNLPGNLLATEIRLSKSLAVARANTQAVLSQTRYGGTALILRVRNVPEPDLLASVPGNEDVVAYSGSIPLVGNLEVYEIGTTELSDPPLFQI